MMKLWYMKIIYVNCGVTNYMKVDHHSYRRNFCSCEKKAWKKSCLHGIQTLFVFKRRETEGNLTSSSCYSSVSHHSSLSNARHIFSL